MYPSIRSITDIIKALILSYAIWAVISLNGWTRVMRQGCGFYYSYQFFFIIFLLIFFWIYMTFQNERTRHPLLLSGFGLGAGYLASILAFCLWLLLMPNGWHRFLYMRWDFRDLPISGFIAAGWLNGVIMAGVLWITNWGSKRQKAVIFGIVTFIAFIRLVFEPEAFLRDILPCYKSWVNKIVGI